MALTKSKLRTITQRRRFPSPTQTPQALAWDDTDTLLWMGSRNLRQIYAIDPKKWTVLEERETPGIPWAAVATNGTLRLQSEKARAMIAIFTDSFPTRAFRRATELLARSLPVHNFSYDGE